MTKITPKLEGRTFREVMATQAEIDIAYKLAESIDKHPQKWKQDEYVFTGPGPIVLWIANGKDNFGQYRWGSEASEQPVILSKQVCQAILWPAYVAWKLQINSAYLNPAPRFGWLKGLFRRRKKPVALLEYKPQAKI